VCVRVCVCARAHACTHTYLFSSIPLNLDLKIWSCWRGFCLCHEACISLLWDPAKVCQLWTNDTHTGISGSTVNNYGSLCLSSYISQVNFHKIDVQICCFSLAHNLGFFFDSFPLNPCKAAYTSNLMVTHLVNFVVCSSKLSSNLKCWTSLIFSHDCPLKNKHVYSTLCFSLKDPHFEIPCQISLYGPGFPNLSKICQNSKWDLTTIISTLDTPVCLKFLVLIITIRCPIIHLEFVEQINN